MPTLDDSHTTDGIGSGLFTTTVSGLDYSSKYHFRAYATNSAGTSYGQDITCATSYGTEGVEAALPGFYTINSNGEIVHFSQGNLQYQAFTSTWRFAEHQWDFVGNNTYGNVYENDFKCNNSDIASNYFGWIDLFGWATSGNGHGAINYQPWSISSNEANYYAYGNASYSLGDQNGTADWGYSAISNGGNEVGLWHTLSADEWSYLMFSRQTPSGIRFARGQVHDVYGMILLPDTWDSQLVTLYDVNNAGEPQNVYNINHISNNTWDNIMEPNGCVFLPITGWRHATNTHMLLTPPLWLLLDRNSLS